MAEIHLNVTETVLKLVEPRSLVGTGVNYDTCTFTFGPEWKGYTKTAVFYSSKNREPIAILLDEKDKCIIPWESISDSGLLYIGIFGIKDIVEIPTNFVTIMIVQGAAGNNVPPPPSLSAYKQILDKVTEVKAVENSFNGAELERKTNEEERQQAYLDFKGDIQSGTGLKNELKTSITIGNELDNKLKEDISLGNALDLNLNEDITQGNTLDKKLKENIATGNTLKTEIEKDITTANTSKENLEKVIETANTTTYATKGEIKEVNAQLADIVQDKMNKNTNDISILQINKSKGLIDESYLSQSLKSQISGNTPISPNIGIENVKYNNLSKNSPLLFAEGIILRENLYDYTKSVNGGYSSIGVFNPADTSRKTSDYIPVLENSVYYRLLSTTILIALFDANKTFISRVEVNNIINIPVGVTYIRITLINAEYDKDIIARQSPLKYVPFGTYEYTITDLFKCNNPVLRNGTSPTFLEGIKPIQNIFDISTSIEGGLSSTGTVSSVTANFVSEFILIKPNVKYFRNIANTIFLVAFYDNTKAFINRLTVASGIYEFTTPSNAKYIRITDLKATMSNYTISEYDNREYIPFQYDVLYSFSNKYVFNSTYTSKFKGKTLVCFGDSITFGEGSTIPSLNSYPSILQNKYGINVINKGISGATWANYGDGYDNLSILTQIANTDFSNVDYVTIFAGTNDFGRGYKPIGANIDNIETTMKGAINLALQRIIMANPKTRIVIITPMWRQRFAPGDNLDSDFNQISGKYLKDFVDAIVESSDYNHIPCFDLYYNCLINKYNYQTYLADGLHPNNIGYELLADMIHGFLNKTY